MKKYLLITAALLATVAGSAQTTRQVTPNKDTVIYTPATYTPEKYTPSVYTPGTITIAPYKAPATTTPPPVVITGPATFERTTTNNQVYYNGKSNVTISNQVIDLKNGGAIAVNIINCKNVRITNCIIKNTSEDGIQFNGCSNVEVDHCFITNVQAGVNAIKCTTVKVHDNQFLNMNGPFPSGNFVQFDQVSGSGNLIANNMCEDIAGQAQHPQDGLSVYKSTGLPGDSIMVVNNYIRGGQVQNDSGGGAGIVLGDVGGSYQVARYNVVVNGGFVGMQVQGGSHIKMDHNTIYGAVTPYSNCGLCYGNYSGQASTDITIAYNKVKYFQTSGKEMDAWVDPKAGYTPIGWSTNILKANIDATILPTTLITFN